MAGQMDHSPYNQRTNRWTEAVDRPLPDGKSTCPRSVIGVVTCQKKNHMTTQTLAWSSDRICLQSRTANAVALAEELYARTCRTNFDAPGFCLLNVGNSIDSIAFRRLMVDLKSRMCAIHEARMGKSLVYLSAARFDQQESTKPHLDGGPDECFLMLGYEPSNVDAELEISDYSKCAFDLGITPKEFLSKHNPMYRSGYEMLRPYTTRIPCFSPKNFQIVCINNSSTPYSHEHLTWQGTLHTATILTPNEFERRVINSTMIASAPIGTLDAISESQQLDFVRTAVVHRRGYDKLHLEDDT